MNQSNIRNFAIIAHIDHGKSTLADRLLEITHTVEARDMSAQLLDSNPIERERGITIKLAPVRMKYKTSTVILSETNNSNTGDPSTSFQDDTKKEYILNLIDTPGHVDFAYEVSRSLAACEGAILVVDATQGIQAQTLANLHQAQQHKLVIIPVLNKIDLPNARVEECLEELSSLGFNPDEVLHISAKTGQNVPAVLEAVVTRIPAPSGEADKPLRALIFSSQYDTHKGVVVFVRVVDGSLNFSNNLTLKFMASEATVDPIEVGYFIPKMIEGKILEAGEVGYIATGLKDIRFAKVGDTITIAAGNKQQATSKASAMHDAQTLDAVHPLPGYKEPKSMVFLGLKNYACQIVLLPSALFRLLP